MMDRFQGRVVVHHGVIKSLFAILSLLVPAAAVLYVCGGWVLGVVGADYAAGGVAVLRVMVVASLFARVNYVYFAIKRIQKDVKGIVVLNGVVFGLVVGLGYAWVVANGVGCGVSGRCSMRRGGETILSRRTNSLIGEYHGTKSDTQG